ncbi:MAG: sulfatase-like hydrolase/transferase [Sulfurimonas sp.]|nr:sulfatase-like hydrolase/transferase [Sulfurimonas sp.]
MQKYQHFNFLLNLLYSVLKLFLVTLVLMSLSRLYLFINYATPESYSYFELFDAFFLGFRLDASILAYANTVGVLLIFIVWLFKMRFLQNYLYAFYRAYFVLSLTFISFLTFVDLIYFSFFGEHSTLMVFGIFDDDTQALIKTAFDNYNVWLFTFLLLGFFFFLYFLIFKIIKVTQKFELKLSWIKQLCFFLALIAGVALVARGTVGIFTIYHNVSDVSKDPLINKLPLTPTLALFNSYKQYNKSKSGNYDLIKSVGYRGNMLKAFEVFKQTKDIDRQNLLNNLVQKTSKAQYLKDRSPHVVVVMVESFGMPLLDYQSKSFNIMGKLKKHFDEDIVFRSFISSSNGTISSLEPLLLNITARPGSISFSQSPYLNTNFTQASARVYADAGYETSFVYGGDLSWRNVGSFMSRQGFEHTRGKGSIVKSLNKNTNNISHDWGVFDEYLYQYVYDILENATTPQFIFVLTTNNHPPYTVPSDYKSNSLKISKKLRQHITGDLDLAQKRFKDYAYAVDSAGEFLDKIKSSPFAQNIVVGMTADNNTVEGIMKYDNYFSQTKRIPFYIYLPDDLKQKEPIDTTVASSHKDIFPTLYNLTLYDKKYTAIGTSLLDKTILHCGFNDSGILMARDGGFKDSKASTPSQKECLKYYKASLAVTEYLIKSNKK